MGEDENMRRRAAPYLQNRELSWLEFNKRVLDQGADDTVPLLERLSFISIFWSNLQEFFMVRVGSLTDLALLKKTIIDAKSGMTPAEQLEAVYKRCHQLYPYYAQCFKKLRELLGVEGIRNVDPHDSNEEQRAVLTQHFRANVMPFLSPQIVNAHHPFPHLENGALYVVVRLDEQGNKKKHKTEKGGAEGVTLGIVPLPRQCERIVALPGKGCQFMLLEKLIEMNAAEIFSMYKVKHTNIVCVTRNADLDAAEGEDEQGADYREQMKRILKRRARLAPVRLESQRELSTTVKRELLDRLHLKSHQCFVSSVPLDMSYVYELAGRVSADQRARLTYPPFTPAWPACLDRTRSVINQVVEGDKLISYPYESMDSFDMLLREAAVDPAVVSIKITLYRLAKQSRMAEALIAAAEAGKDVTAIFELRARFDESNNIEWSQRFEQAGCKVLYGFRNLKVHSKICCITRQTPDGPQYITQMGTGNYNEKTAALYTDFSFMTADPQIGRDADAFFRNLALENLSDEYRTLWVAPLMVKQNILAGIDEQIERHRRGLPSGLFFKTNSITDRDIIEKIVEASRAGVRCTLLVRGISCIVPGLADYTANICVVSIVGRLLEHSRIYCFGPLDGDVRIYLSSADLMTRNMDKRVEVAWPLLDARLRSEVVGYIGTCMSDTAKLRDLLPNKEYTPLRFFATEDPATGRIMLFDSQEYLIGQAQEKRLEAAEMEAFRHQTQAVPTIGAYAETPNVQVEPTPPVQSEQKPSTPKAKKKKKKASPEVPVVTIPPTASTASSGEATAHGDTTPANMPAYATENMTATGMASASAEGISADAAHGLTMDATPHDPRCDVMVPVVDMPLAPAEALAPDAAPAVHMAPVHHFGMKVPPRFIGTIPTGTTAPIDVARVHAAVDGSGPLQPVSLAMQRYAKNAHGRDEVQYDSPESFFEKPPEDNQIVIPREKKTGFFERLFGGN